MSDHLQVAVVARDPGAAAALAPVARALRDLGIHTGTFALTPAAAAAFARGGIESVGGSPPRADVLLSGTSTMPARDAALWAAARAGGSRVVVLIDHWTYLVERLAGTLPDLICVIDCESRAVMMSDGVPGERIVAVGHPALDEVLKRAPSLKGARDGRVAFVSEPLSLLPEPPPMDERAAAAMLDRALVAAPAPLLVRAHPREDLEEVMRRFASREPATVEPLVGDPLPPLARVSAILGMGSMLLVEAALMGTPVAAVRTEQEAARFPGSAIEALVSTVPDADACIAFLQAALGGRADPSRAEVWAAARSIDGTSTDRVVGAVFSRA